MRWALMFGGLLALALFARQPARVEVAEPVVVKPPRVHAPPRPVAPTLVSLEPAHPITVEHARLGRVQQLLGALHDALDLADPERMRSLLGRFGDVEPEDPQLLREGFERIVDCLEAEDPQAQADARANAAHYYEQARASTLRRHIRRHCLSAPP